MERITDIDKSEGLNGRIPLLGRKEKRKGLGGVQRN